MSQHEGPIRGAPEVDRSRASAQLAPETGQSWPTFPRGGAEERAVANIQRKLGAGSGKRNPCGPRRRSRFRAAER